MQNLRAGGRARARGRGAGASACASRGLAEPQSQPEAVLSKIVAGRETVVMGVDAVAALMGVVYCRQEGYLVNRDGCFY